MRTIGLIGGMSWESSIEYYRIINERVRELLGGTHSARSVMVSVDFAEIETLQRQDRWDEATLLMVEAARQVQRGGGECVVICTNTMHLMAEDVQAAIDIPLLHIADATASQVKAQRLGTVGLLGTRFTMEGDFYRGRLVERHGLNVLIPEGAEREIVHRVIYDELVLGQILPASRGKFASIIENLVQRGAQGIILGCTEIGLLVKPEDSPVPVFDTTYIHAAAAVDWALAVESEQISVHPISAEQARPLREAILRPGYPPELSIYPGDDHPLALHAGAFLGEQLVGIASLFHQPPPFDPHLDGWRLRGMAVVEASRRKGAGKALVQACLAYARDNGAEVVWCYARTSAAPFYRSLGFREHGQEFDIPESGPHYVMWRKMK